MILETTGLSTAQIVAGYANHIAGMHRLMRRDDLSPARRRALAMLLYTLVEELNAHLSDPDDGEWKRQVDAASDAMESYARSLGILSTITLSDTPVRPKNG